LGGAEGGGEREREREAAAPVSRNPDAGLDPRTQRSYLEPKADTAN